MVMAVGYAEAQGAIRKKGFNATEYREIAARLNKKKDDK